VRGRNPKSRGVPLDRRCRLLLPSPCASLRLSLILRLFVPSYYFRRHRLLLPSPCASSRPSPILCLFVPSHYCLGPEMSAAIFKRLFSTGWGHRENEVRGRNPMSRGVPLDRRRRRLLLPSPCASSSPSPMILRLFVPSRATLRLLQLSLCFAALRLVVPPLCRLPVPSDGLASLRALALLPGTRNVNCRVQTAIPSEMGP
jgi:hypothetical protein